MKKKRVNENEHHFINTEEYQHIINDWNQTDRPYPNDKTIHQLFEEQVEKTPQNVALIFENQQLTYKELNERANQLARYIGPQVPDTLIAICIERSLEMVIGILGILKAGAAYVPIDPQYPDERQTFILKDTRCKIKITQELIEKSLGETKGNLLSKGNANDLAYVIYTSGTTGQPKGVMLNHSGLNNLCQCQIDSFKITKKSIVLQFASISFDAAVSEIFTALTSGAALLIATEAVRHQPESLLKVLKEQQVSVTTLPPALLQNIEYEDLPNLETLVLAGEPCPTKVMAIWGQGRRLINAYGPTENTVATTMHVYQKGDLNTNIGRPIDNTLAYILDSKLNPVPVGVIGELYIGGAGLARGYLNRIELTQERFIVNPFATKKQQAKGYTRLYKTGDVVRWLADGNIEYIERNDFQVKLRGFRIELGEIENVMNSHPSVKQSVVLLKEQGENKYLVGYYVAEPPIDENAIRQHLAQSVPEYMVPSMFVPLKALPLTINGKLDRKALPNPKFVSTDRYVEPSDEVETEFCRIWAEAFGLQKVGIQDDFFKMGGNSILAIQVIHRMSKVIDQHIPVASLFQYKNIQALKDTLSSFNPISNIENVPADKGALSYAQERLWFIERYEQGTNAYHIPLLFELPSTLDIQAFKQSLASIVERHEVLRTLLKQDESGTDYQQVFTMALPIEEIKTNASMFKAELKASINEPFDLIDGYPIRVALYQVAKKQYALINIHHIAFDGWSVNIFIKELIAFYEHYSHRLALNIPELSIHYKDFAGWQRHYLKGEVLAKQIEHWQQHLTGYETLVLPTDKTRPKKIDYHGHSISFELGKELSAKLKALAQSRGVTLYVVLLSGFYILLHKYTGQEDIIIGTPVANRHYSQIENLIGFFVNSLALRARVDGEQSFGEILEATHKEMIEAQRYQDLPFEKVVEALKVEQDLSRHPLFQVMFGVQNFGQETTSQDALFKPMTLLDVYEVAKFDLSLFINEGQEGLLGNINYATSLFEEETIVWLTKHYVHLLNTVIEKQDAPISEISILLPEEYQQIVYDWNQTDKPYPNDKTIHQLFEEQVEKTPQNIALVFESQQLTYKELNERANQLARYIGPQAPDTLIAICMERSLEIMIGILGILKAGAAYVPIDPEYPEERQTFILKDTQCKIKVTKELIEKSLGEAKDNLLNNGNANDLAYVIYTSGTTGQPKGVMIEHRSASNAMQIIKAMYQIEENHNVSAAYTAFVFDMSVAEFFSTLLQGGELHLLSKAVRSDISGLTAYLLENKINYIFLPPAILALLPKSSYPDLKHIMIGGEPCEQSSGEYWANHCTLMNYYGPTEATIYATGAIVKPTHTNMNIIGLPLNNTKLYILDKNLKPTSIGITGELYIGGVCLARGYLNREALTQERFIANLYATEADKARGYTRLYKTGDLVRWLADGSIEYIGRNDSQVKLRGFRIELGEIEKAISAYAGVKQAVVLLQEQAESKYLVGYYVAESPIDEKAIRQYLAQLLPKYMIPSVFVSLKALPLTINGKLDRKALPNPTFISMDSYVAPRDEMEASLCQLWAEVLGLERVGIEDDFFNIGGNSILAIRLVSKMEKQLAIKVLISEVFTHRTIVTLVAHLKTKKSSTLINVMNTYHKAQKNVWMVHPGASGAEVYQNLASLLEGFYNCYGVNNYNHNAIKQIDNLSELAKVYIAQMKMQEEYDENEIILLGWCIGGAIALEMASQLEKAGAKNIYVYLLDTLIRDKEMQALQAELHNPKIKQDVRKFMSKEGYEDVYIKKVLSAWESEAGLSNQTISSPLEHAEVILYKANLVDDRFDKLKALSQYFVSISDNNVGQIVKKLTLVTLNCHHGNILELETALIVADLKKHLLADICPK
ncbi:MAG: amino acid adenylation domain-containing protein [Gammaproteobacteria bacterium]|nr:amino acid adenylation domain-containing protein [Gammaproteobacteria bacterium]